MTVRELIVKLEKIEDKDLEVVTEECCGWDSVEISPVEEILETTEYFGKVEEGGYVAKTRLCVKLLP